MSSIIRPTPAQRTRRLVVLDQGRVVEVGTHEELIAKRGHFHHLVHLQQVTSEIIAVSGK